MQQDKKLSKQELIRLLELSRRELDVMRTRHAMWSELASVGFLTLDARGFILELNQQAAILLGSTPEPHLHQPLQRYLAPEAREALQEHLHRVCLDGERISDEFRRRQVPGEPVHLIRLDSRSWFEADGAVRCLTSLSDITERKQAEQALRESEQRSRWALQAAGGGAWDWDLTEGKAWWSDEMYELWGVKPGTRMRLENSLALVVEADRELLGNAVETAIAGRSAYRCEFRIRHPFRGERWMASLGRLVLDEEGIPQRLLGLTFDITQRKRAEQELARARRAAEQRAAELEALLQAVPAAVWIAHDRECRHVTGNRTANQWLRLPDWAEASLTAQRAERPDHFKIFRDGRELSGNELPVQLAARGIEVRDFEEEIRFEDGSVIPVFGNATPLWDEQGRSRGAVAAFVDISERKRAEQALRDTDRRKDEFLAILAHELRNPLAPIRNAVELLKLQGCGDANLETARRIIERQLQHMVRLIDDLLDVGRITRGRLELRKQRVELAAVLQQAIETSRPQIERAEHLLSVHLPSRPISLDADPVRLSQVFVNLLNNACSYMQQGGEISLSVESTEAEVVVKVKDTGIGISAEFQPHLFEMFSQMGSNQVRDQGGLGIGLSLAKHLVELHGGRIEAASPGLGQGSEFSVHLPVRAQEPLKQESCQAEQPTVEGAAPKLRILVVDDNRDAVESLAMLLRVSGYEVETASDGQAAVEEAERYRPDLVLLDIGMPRLDGYSACQRIRKHIWSRGMRIIALTGWGQEEDRRKAEAAGFDGYLVKPVAPDALQQLLAETRTR